MVRARARRDVNPIAMQSGDEIRLDDESLIVEDSIGSCNDAGSLSGRVWSTGISKRRVRTARLAHALWPSAPYHHCCLELERQSVLVKDLTAGLDEFRDSIVRAS
ncbi:hypothetical protein [Natrinema halophilum]|uniref:Uncharacterized protein n=1 Tax=Natrinema halophilum TaxID=1699371 RepID=A0A7D5GT22_9EURY|nr:hypothetical protein [Natrinema halophilum]QLG49026.1 hypothetical protein HYG82_09285 [Natrinema halophilum]